MSGGDGGPEVGVSVVGGRDLGRRAGGLLGSWIGGGSGDDGEPSSTTSGGGVDSLGSHGGASDSIFSVGITAGRFLRIPQVAFFIWEDDDIGEPVVFPGLSDGQEEWFFRGGLPPDWAACP